LAGGDKLRRAGGVKTIDIGEDAMCDKRLKLCCQAAFRLGIPFFFLTLFLQTYAWSDDISPTFSYQGLLSEDGSGVTGSRDMRFQVFSDSSCTTNVGNAIIRNGVVIENGIFSVELTMPLPPEDIFAGEARWLEVQVEGTQIGCQELFVTPYAFSIKPGAKVEGSKPQRWAIYGRNTATTGQNAGVRGETLSADGAGVYASGYGTGADLILGGNGGSLDDGKIFSEPGATGSDIYLVSNDMVRVELDDDNNDLVEEFVIVNGENSLIFKVEGDGTVTQGGTGISAFPRPAYDSDWVFMGLGDEVTLTHGIGGDALDYVVDMTCYIPGVGNDGINNRGVGIDVTTSASYGACWRQLTNDTIKIWRFSDDDACPQIRIRIWAYP